jgi:hypothetical protein
MALGFTLEQSNLIYVVSGKSGGSKVDPSCTTIQDVQPCSSYVAKQLHTLFLSDKSSEHSCRVVQVVPPPAAVLVKDTVSYVVHAVTVSIMPFITATVDWTVAQWTVSLYKQTRSLVVQDILYEPSPMALVQSQEIVLLMDSSNCVQKPAKSGANPAIDDADDDDVLLLSLLLLDDDRCKSISTSVHWCTDVTA